MKIKITKNDKERIIKRFKNVNINKNGCFLWEGAVNSHNYGLIKIDQKVYQVHRIIYMLFKGSIPKNICICHHCDIPNCINPEHLFLGTRKDNMDDMSKKRRHPNTRLTNIQILEIKEKYKKNKYITQEILAKQYNISR